MKEARFARIKHFLFDLDGTLIHAGAALPGAAATLAALAERGGQIVFCTEDTERSEETIAAALRGMGLAVRAEQIVTAGALIVALLRGASEAMPIRLIASDAQRAYLVERGVRLAEANEPVGALLIEGFGGFSAEDLDVACAAVRAGAIFLTSAVDRSFRTAHGRIPGAGALVRAVEHVTRKRARILAKPSKEMAAFALARLGAEAGETLVVGDNLDVDIKMARAMGAPSALTLTGVTSAAEAARAGKNVRPDVVLAGVADLLGVLAE